MPLAALSFKLPIRIDGLFQRDNIARALLENVGHPAEQLMVRFINLPLSVK